MIADEEPAIVVVTATFDLFDAIMVLMYECRVKTKSKQAMMHARLPHAERFNHSNSLAKPKKKTTLTDKTFEARAMRIPPGAAISITEPQLNPYLIFPIHDVNLENRVRF